MTILRNKKLKYTLERPEKRVKIGIPILFVCIANRRLEQFEKK